MTGHRSRRTGLVVLALLVFWAVAPGTGPWLRSVGESAAQLYRYRNSGRESRAASLLGDAWLLVDQAARTTPVTARILIPEGAEFDPVSNRTWCAYYLHPRTLLQPSDIVGAPADAADWLLAYRGSARGLPGLPPGLLGDAGTGLVPLAPLRDASADTAGGTP